MRAFLMLSAGALALAATPASARDGAWYVGGDFGATIVEDIEFATPAADSAVTLDHEYGYDGALFVGYDLGAFRLEAEVAYKRASLDEFENTILIDSDTGWHPVGRREGFGHDSALSFMINGMLDFGDDDGLSGFVGAGVGVARVDYHNLRAFENAGVFVDDADTRFAWQLVAGIRQSVSDNVDVTLRYRFFNVEDVRLEGFGGTTQFDTHFRSHSLLGGITFNFGAPPPPP